MLLVSLWTKLITEERTLTTWLYVAVVDIIKPYFYPGCADLRAPVSYKLLPPEKRTNYSVLDKLVFFVGQFASKKKLEKFDGKSTF